MNQLKARSLHTTDTGMESDKREPLPSSPPSKSNQKKKVESDWRGEPDRKLRKRIQNRSAQRRHRTCAAPTLETLWIVKGQTETNNI